MGKKKYHYPKKPRVPSYEGRQYTGGREKGVPNLKRTTEGLLNMHGVVFKEEEKKALETAVNTANRKRARMLKEEATLPRTVKGKPTSDTVQSLHLMGYESDFILSRKTKSLQRFKSRADYDTYMRNLERVNSRDYIEERTKLYKRNYMTALENEFGDDAKDIIMKVRMMKPAEFRKRIQQDDLLEIYYIYDSNKKEARANQIRASFGMRLKELPDEELE